MVCRLSLTEEAPASLATGRMNNVRNSCKQNVYTCAFHSLAKIACLSRVAHGTKLIG